MQNNLAWIYPHEKYFYHPGKILDYCEEENFVELQDLDNKKIYKQKFDELIKINNNNFNEIMKIDDLLNLDELNEGILLTSIRWRFKKKIIYTQIGEPILIALNPFQRLNIYSDENRKNYQKSNLSNLKPHLYKLGQNTFNNLNKGEKSQSIIITGESGAGKTESVKYLLRYFANLENKSTKTENSIEQKILSTNPILETFGNARTLRNDNSSRFGKYIKIFFDNKTNNISYASINNYLLEQSRIITQSKNERNYHIFYHVLLICDDEFKRKYKLLDDDDETFDFSNMLNMDYDRFDQTLESDKELFEETIDNMKKIGFKDEKIDDIFKIVSSVLHLSKLDIEFDKKEGNSEIFKIKNNISYEIVCEFLGISEKDFNQLICFKKLKLPDREIHNPQKEKDCKLGILSFIKIIYSNLFDHLVNLINLSIFKKQNNKSKFNIISLLDIFGFEIFINNSFEQLCINFTNEKLQQHFNEHMFIIEKKIYNEENIEFNFTNLPDNKIIIELIENKGGLFDLLDEQNKFEKGSYVNFINNLDKIYQDNPIYVSKQKTLNKKLFGIKHFAGEVDYDTEFFVEKNKNNIKKEIKEILIKSKNKTIKEIFIKNDSNSKNVSVSYIFKEQLNKLMNNLNKSRSSYVRCIKPNNKRSSEIFENTEICRQLRCGGILEAVKVRKSGFGVRKNYRELVKKWDFLIKNILKNIKDLNDKEIIKKLIESLKKNKLNKNYHNQYRIGNTKLFMKETFIYKIDSLINDLLKDIIIKIQSNFKCILAKIKYKSIRNNIIKIQRFYKNLSFKNYINFKISNKNSLAQNLIKLFNFEKNYESVLKKINTYKKNYSKKIKQNSFKKKTNSNSIENNEIMINEEEGNFETNIKPNNKNKQKKSTNTKIKKDKNRKFKNEYKNNDIRNSDIINADIRNSNIFKANDQLNEILEISKKQNENSLNLMYKEKISKSKLKIKYLKNKLKEHNEYIKDLQKDNEIKDNIILDLEQKLKEFENIDIQNKINQIKNWLDVKNNEIEELNYELNKFKNGEQLNKSKDRILKLLFYYYKWNQNKKYFKKNLENDDNNELLKEKYQIIKGEEKNLIEKINLEMKVYFKQNKNHENNNEDEESDEEDISGDEDSEEEEEEYENEDYENENYENEDYDNDTFENKNKKENNYFGNKNRN